MSTEASNNQDRQGWDQYLDKLFVTVPVCFVALLLLAGFVQAPQHNSLLYGPFWLTYYWLFIAPFRIAMIRVSGAGSLSHTIGHLALTVICGTALFALPSILMIFSDALFAFASNIMILFVLVLFCTTDFDDKFGSNQYLTQVTSVSLGDQVTLAKIRPQVVDLRTKLRAAHREVYQWPIKPFDEKKFQALMTDKTLGLYVDYAPPLQMLLDEEESVQSSWQLTFDAYNDAVEQLDAGRGVLGLCAKACMQDLAAYNIAYDEIAVPKSERLLVAADKRPPTSTLKISSTLSNNAVTIPWKFYHQGGLLGVAAATAAGAIAYGINNQRAAREVAQAKGQLDVQLATFTQDVADLRAYVSEGIEPQFERIAACALKLVEYRKSFEAMKKDGSIDSVEGEKFRARFAFEIQKARLEMAQKAGTV